MTPADLALPVVIGTMAANHLVMRVVALRGHPLAFWPLQVLNLVVGSSLIMLGLPGFDTLPIVAWMLALLFFFRVVLNNNERQRWLLEQRGRNERHGEQAVRQAFVDALRRGEGREGPRED